MKRINKLISLLYVACFLLFLAGCTKEDIEYADTAPVISGLEPEYYVLVREKLELSPQIENEVDSVEWLLDNKKIANTVNYTFEALNVPGVSRLILRAYNTGNIVQKNVTITTGRFANIRTAPNKLVWLEASDVFTGKERVNWDVLTAPSSLFRLVPSDTRTGLFLSFEKGVYQLRASSGELADTVIVTVQRDLKSQSPYIAQVFDYLPAPGQFVNELPKYTEGDTQEEMNEKVARQLVGEDANMITLGGWGGYVVLGFDHTVINLPDKRDFRIYGNAFGASANPRPNAPFGGSCEPALVMVAYDKNKNGKPDDDEWYEIKGSGNFTAESEPWYQAAVENGNDVRTFRDYEMTYYKPETEEPDQSGVVDDPKLYATINKYIRWTDNQGQEGYKIKNIYHTQTYYPAWIKENKVTYKGVRLSNNSIDESKQGSYYVLYAFQYGYVDNYPNSHDNSGIDIDWAIDKDGNKVDLPGIDFVKVYNGIDQENGWLGEASTEVGRGEDLHLLGISIDTIKE